MPHNTYDDSDNDYDEHDVVTNPPDAHSEEGGGDDDDLARKIDEALERAHDAAMTEFNRHPESEPYALVGIKNLDGRKKFVRRFKRVADKAGPRRFEHPDLPYTLQYSAGQDSYVLQHYMLDNSQSMAQKFAAYQTLYETLANREYAKEGDVYVERK